MSPNPGVYIPAVIFGVIVVGILVALSKFLPQGRPGRGACRIRYRRDESRHGRRHVGRPHHAPRRTDGHLRQADRDRPPRGGRPDLQGQHPGRHQGRLLRPRQQHEGRHPAGGPVARLPAGLERASASGRTVRRQVLRSAEDRRQAVSTSSNSTTSATSSRKRSSRSSAPT